MKHPFFRILLLVLIYLLIVAMWQAQQALGIGRAFVYSLF